MMSEQSAALARVTSLHLQFLLTRILLLSAPDTSLKWEGILGRLRTCAKNIFGCFGLLCWRADTTLLKSIATAPKQPLVARYVNRMFTSANFQELHKQIS